MDSHAPDAPSSIVAQMGDKQLLADEVALLIRSKGADEAARLANQPEDVYKLVKEEMIKRYLLKEAILKGVDRHPESQFLMQRAAEQALVARYMDQQSRAGLKPPSDQVVERWYEQNRERFRQTDHVHIAQIYLAVPDTASEAHQAEIEQKIKTLFNALQDRPSLFSSLAKTHSDHRASAEEGGDMGWLPLDQLMPGLVPIVQSMQPGTISLPIASPQGWHLLQLMEKRPGDYRPLAEVRPLIERELLQQIKRQREILHIQNLLKRLPVTLHEGRIDALPLRAE
ncbi:MAG: peptidylprolyl isomerase [Magnetococcales bacterium]|nr:peptidylprolyl isomerase [Magnetococcales bacterium]